MTNDKIKIASTLLDVASMTTPAFGLTGLLTKKMIEAVTKSTELADKGDVTKLEEEAVIQEIESRISEFQAKVAQELAIAKRIENAYEVEIEEFYDSSGEGNLGFQVKDKSLNLGASGAGRKITRRIYRFKGLSEEK